MISDLPVCRGHAFFGWTCMHANECAADLRNFSQSPLAFGFVLYVLLSLCGFPMNKSSSRRDQRSTPILCQNAVWAVLGKEEWSDELSGIVHSTIYTSFHHTRQRGQVS
ncbi:hypothetical protein DINM_005312 [Dirofilaria immitis]|nr:hypothetical protein [Dirofilaria immitis]